MAANFINDTDVLRLASKVNALRGAGMVPSGGLLFNKGNFFQLMVTGESAVSYTIVAEPSDTAFQTKANIVSGLGAFALGAALYMNGYFIQAFGDMAGSGGGGGGSLPDGDTVDQTIQWDGSAWQPGIIPADGAIWTMDATLGAALPTVKQDPASALPVAYVVLDLSVGDGNGGLYGMLDETGAAAFQLTTSGFPATPALNLLGPGGAGSVTLDTTQSTLKSPGATNQLACSATAISLVHGGTTTYSTAGTNSGNSYSILTRPFGATFGLAFESVSTTLQGATTATNIVLGTSDITHTSSVQHRFNRQVVPTATGTLSLGTASFAWSQVYAAASTILPSDENIKSEVLPITDAVLDAVGAVEFVSYKFNSAIALKGSEARTHFGIISQRLKEAFEERDLDPFAYGVLCYDEWDAAPEVLNGEGEVLVPALAAGNLLSIRYDELMVLNAAYMRRELARLSSN